MKRETGLRTVILLIILGLCVISFVPTVRVFMHKNEVNLALEKRTREIFKAHPGNL